jgi:hypothetical protein
MHFVNCVGSVKMFQFSKNYFTAESLPSLDLSFFLLIGDFFLLLCGVGYIVAFTKFLTTYQINYT